ncbi:bifunctional biotin--[acetyl-CoA-carboxylase] ligase/biotin operon repressor BirA [Shewanella algae]|uniref:bifunctional biotin--[acetyl-CoA-carboxylase] ligase/biotin operon repressor BirA n=1 Tax=Shewanella algae TaxID=38313 RepID=UPI001682F6C0|nr:bifunctional biotin--[acetyl-CoA-carboxylase] ligase/biotin operon repressor BirA [Shewanella algae]MBO2589090.1 bifunctional biotin--[acetyl-CoA-carboxylase] ligase/biotin operon repressor BirA [Shewanella algae]MBO2626890.1 bifunctional biotin--[acetyl-CoA-carboxylase] ligase/biotin operon repressor BirA [Shewanella algae]QNV03854.1 bifunctional biotin--[acetyl-CoA-carboxylase] ligase/biotin operon repressor BirA [Shewanella algae]QTE95216.1 bifunctional biotin--[acetyl-CoA-carboxylase] li
MTEQWKRKREILQLLQQGEFVSGEKLAEQLGISRTAVSKHISALTAFGIDIFSVKGKGYKLARSLHLIDKPRLLSAIDNRCFYFDELGGTNTFLLNHVDELSNGDLCIAEYQSAGRGRRGRQWVSPYGSHLYFSMYWQFSQGLSQAMGLSLVVACSLVSVLESFGIAGLGVKWPNDIYLDGRKLAGVLIEMSGTADSECDLVIGIGLNMAMPAELGEQLDQPWSDLSGLEFMPNKTELAINLHKQLLKDLKLFETQGLAAFNTRWQSADIFAGQQVKLLLGEQQISGHYLGVDEQGGVILQTETGPQHFVGGEISLRGA